jgi:hypothetical protein
MEEKVIVTVLWVFTIFFMMFLSGMFEGSRESIRASNIPPPLPPSPSHSRSLRFHRRPKIKSNNKNKNKKDYGRNNKTTECRE